MNAAYREAVRSDGLGKSVSNRSLERGVEVLRAFRPGSEMLGNGELAERTGLSAATVSRLTQTLVRCGFLEHDSIARAYRLAAPVLSLAHAMQTGSSVLQAASPMMLDVAQKLRINVGLATPDRDEMVYLKSIRYHPKVSLRTIVAGQRIPIELTSLGRACLAVMSKAQKDALITHFRQRRGADWPKLEREISLAGESVLKRGFCAAAWQPEVVALATPVVLPGRPILALNLSVGTQASIAAVSKEFGSALLDLADRIGDELRKSGDF